MKLNFRGSLASGKLDRLNLREGQAGQAAILIAFFMLFVIWLFGLVIDVEMAHIQSDKTRDAAQDSARAGAPFVYTNRATADTNAILAAESQGFKVACFYNSNLAGDDPYNQRCRRADWESVKRNAPDQLYYFESKAVSDKNAVHYSVTLGKLQSRLLLSTIGFPNYPLLQTATATYQIPPVKTPPPAPPVRKPEEPKKPPVQNPPASYPNTDPFQALGGGLSANSLSQAQQICTSLKKLGATAQSLPANCK